MPVDFSQFQKALQGRAKITRRREEEVTNKAMLNVAYRAAKYTPVASKSQIRSQIMRDPHLRFAIVSLANKGQKFKSPEFAQRVEEFVNRRVQSTRYLRSGWAQAIIDLGGSFRGSRLTRGASGRGKKARVWDPYAEIVAILKQPTGRKVEGAEDVLIKALQEAVDFVAKDMIAHDFKKVIKAIEEGK